MTYQVDSSLGLSTYPESGGNNQEHRQKPENETLQFADSVFVERRSAARRRMLKQAEIEFEGNFGNIPCILRNISDSGALIELDGSYIVPHHFDLIIIRDGTKVTCEMIRQDNLQIGIQFTGTAENFRPPEKQYIQASSDGCLRTLARIENSPRITPPETELDIYRRRNNSQSIKQKFGKR